MEIETIEENDECILPLSQSTLLSTNLRLTTLIAEKVSSSIPEKGKPIICDTSAY